MSVPAIPHEDGKEAGQARRHYDSSLRRSAPRRPGSGSSRRPDLVHGFPLDWRDLTFGAVAERAGVGKRTVYRYFPNRTGPARGIMRRLQEEAGVSYEPGLTTWPASPHACSPRCPRTRSPVAGRTCSSRRWWPRTSAARRPHRCRHPVGAGLVRPAARKAAAMLDVLWSVPSYERLTAPGLRRRRATEVIAWMIGLLVDAIRHDAARTEPSMREARRLP